MPNLKVAIDVHDAARVHVLTEAEERPRGRGEHQKRDKYHIGAGPMILRLIYHAELFKRQILLQMELPPVAGPRHAFSMRISEKEREMLRRLAAARRWTMTDLVRALVFYHWRIREEFRASAPGLGGENRIDFSRYLSFQPDRLQPWYYFSQEAIQRIEARALEDWNNLRRIMRAHGISEKVIEAVNLDFCRAEDFRDGYEWSGADVSPAELRHEEHKAEGGL